MPIYNDESLISAFQRGQTVFAGIVLKDANLAGAHLPFIHLKQGNLQNANLRNACLPGAHLCQVLLDQASLEHANLLGADLVQANLRQANLDYALLGSANLDGANLTSASLMATSLSNASLRGANLRNANLMGANLMATDLTDANLFGAKIIHSALKEAYLHNTILPDGTHYTTDELTLQQRKQRSQYTPGNAASASPTPQPSDLDQSQVWATAQREFFIRSLIGNPDDDTAAANDIFIFYRKSPTDVNTVYAFRVEPNSMDLTLCAVRKNSPVWATLAAGVNP